MTSCARDLELRCAVVLACSLFFKGQVDLTPSAFLGYVFVFSLFLFFHGNSYVLDFIYLGHLTLWYEEIEKKRSSVVF